jgi:hypothetical protein
MAEEVASLVFLAFIRYEEYRPSRPSGPPPRRPGSHSRGRRTPPADAYACSGVSENICSEPYGPELKKILARPPRVTSR